MPGLTTWAEPRKAVYLRENITGETVQVGVFDPSLPGPENRMRLLAAGFGGLGVSALERCMESDSPWITVDEVGYLEAQSEVYRDALHRLLEKKQVACVPGTAFGDAGEGFARISYAYSIDHLREAFKRIAEFLEEHKGEN